MNQFSTIYTLTYHKQRRTTTYHERRSCDMYEAKTALDSALFLISGSFR